MFKSKCSHCGHRFSRREALCDDWRDPEKSFGCPQCETFFIRVEEMSQFRSGIIGGLFGAGIAYPAMMIFMNDRLPEARLYSGIILASCVMLFLVTAWPVFRRPVRSAYTDRRKAGYS